MDRSRRRLSLALGVLILASLAGGGFLLRSTPKRFPPRPSSTRPPPHEGPETSVPRPETDASSGLAEPAAGKVSPSTESAGKPAPPPVPPTVPIRGTLLDADGRPVPFARVEAYAVSMRGVFAKIVSETDEKGSFRADCPVWSRVTFTAHLPGRGRALYMNLAISDAEHLTFATTEFTMKLFRETSVEGTLGNAAGLPVAGARLRFHPVSHNNFEGGRLNLLNGSIPPDERWDAQCERELYLTDHEGSTDAVGAFRADSLLSGTRYVVEVIREGQSVARVEMTTHRKGPVNLRVDR